MQGTFYIPDAPDLSRWARIVNWTKENKVSKLLIPCVNEAHKQNLLACLEGLEVHNEELTRDCENGKTRGYNLKTRIKTAEEIAGLSRSYAMLQPDPRPMGTLCVQEFKKGEEPLRHLPRRCSYLAEIPAPVGGSLMGAVVHPDQTLDRQALHEKYTAGTVKENLIRLGDMSRFSLENGERWMASHSIHRVIGTRGKQPVVQRLGKGRKVVPDWVPYTSLSMVRENELNELPHTDTIYTYDALKVQTILDHGYNCVLLVPMSTPHTPVEPAPQKPRDLRDQNDKLRDSLQAKSRTAIDTSPEYASVEFDVFVARVLETYADDMPKAFALISEAKRHFDKLKTEVPVVPKKQVQPPVKPVKKFEAPEVSGLVQNAEYWDSFLTTPREVRLKRTQKLSAEITAKPGASPQDELITRFAKLGVLVFLP